MKQALSPAGAAQADPRRAGQARQDPPRLRRRRRRARSSTSRAPRSTGRSARGATSRRSCSPLDEIKAARHAHGVTLNDVVLGVVVGRPAPVAGRRGRAPVVLADRRRPGRHRPARAPAAARGQPGLQHVHHAGHRRRRPARARCRPSPGSPTRPSWCTRRSVPTCSSTGCSSPRRRRSAWSCASTRGCGPPRGTRRRSTWSCPTWPARARSCCSATPGSWTCSASGRSSRASGST